MIIALLLIALLQDGPIRTAPTADPAPQEGSAPAADPGPACTFGGRPVRAAGCPTPPGRLAFDVPIPPVAAQPEGPVLTRIEDCSDPAKRRPSEEEFTCAARFRTEEWMRSVQPDRDQIDWESSAPAADTVERMAEYCAVVANRGPNEHEFDCVMRLEYARRPAGRVGSPGFRVSPDGSDIPAWAFADPAGWEASQCGAEGDDACRRQARNRLAMARAGMAAEAPASGGASGDGQNCRMVMRRSESGFGGSLSRVCGDESGSGAALDALRSTTRPVAEPCDRPATLETQEAWIARCRALPPR